MSFHSWLNAARVRGITVRTACVAVLAVVAALLGIVPATAAPACNTSTPTGGTYTIEVCFSTPADGATLTGKQTVTATATLSANSGTGIRRMVFSLDGQYLLTDYQAPYSFTLDTSRFVDGSHTLTAHTLMRDTFVSNDASITTTFNNGVTTPPVNTKTFTPPAGNAVGAGETYTVVADGDGAGGETSETAVTNLIASMNPHNVLYLGDVYEKGTPTEFDNYYGPETPGSTMYGRFRSITLPTIGNHEYENRKAPGYFDYWDNVAHYYSVNRHGWHIVSLDANSAFGQTTPGTAQYSWLQSDLNSNTQPCTLVFYHQPKFTEGDEGPATNLDAIWSLMAQHGVDLVLNGHDHSYQRFQPLDGAGNPDPAGITEIVSGAGGHATGAFPNPDSRSAFKSAALGAVKLTLGAAGAGYQYVNTTGTILDSGSVQCDPAQTDKTAPSAPTGLKATSTLKDAVNLSWTASSDNVGVTGYRVLRDGTQIATTTGTGTAYTDSTVAAGSTHSYTVRAVDAAGNASSPSNAASVTTPTTSVLFSDDFETGNLSKWTNPATAPGPVNAGLTAQQVDVAAGAWAARSSSSTGGGSSAWHVLAQTEPDLYVSTRFKAIGTHTTANLLRLRNGLAGSNPITTLGLSTTNKLTLRNDAAGTDAAGAPLAATITSAKAAAPDAWHTVQLHAHVSGAASTTEVWLDGVALPEMGVTRGLGTNPIAKLELGDPGSATTAKNWNVAFDNVAYDRSFIADDAPPAPDTTAPTAPANLRPGPAATTTTTNLAWDAATDAVGVTSYRVYRDPATTPVATPTGTSFADTGLTPDTAYTYKVTAVDAAGNESAPSSPLTVSTLPDVTTPEKPGTPTRPTVTVLGDTSIKVSWAAVPGATKYRLLRDGDAIGAEGTSRSYTDTGLAAGSVHRYTVMAMNDGGSSAESPSASATTWYLLDGFGHGLNRWNPVGLTTAKLGSNTVAHAPLTASRVPHYAVKALPGSYSSVTYEMRVMVKKVKKNAVDVLRLRTMGGKNLVAVYYAGNRRIGFRNDATGGTALSARKIAVGRWQTIKVHVAVAGPKSTVGVWLGTTRVLHRTTRLGVTPIGRVVAGETTRGRMYDYLIDNVKVTK